MSATHCCICEWPFAGRHAPDCETQKKPRKANPAGSALGAFGAITESEEHMGYGKTGLELQEVQRENVARSKESFPSKDWTPLEWSGALAGEVGELANLLKKLRRGENVPTEQIAAEIGDVQAYLCLV